MPIQVRTQQHDTVDLLCWRYYGRTTGVTEALLEFNAGLADHGPVLPNGLLVNLPDETPQVPQRNAVNLWN